MLTRVAMLDPYKTPYPRSPGPPGLIDRAVGRCKELQNTESMDTGEGHLILMDDDIGFLTDRAKDGRPSIWKMSYSQVRSFEVRKGLFGFWQLIIDGPAPPEGRVFHVRLGSFGARNAAHILRAKGVPEVGAGQ